MWNDHAFWIEPLKVFSTPRAESFLTHPRTNILDYKSCYSDIIWMVIVIVKMVPVFPL